MNARYLKYRSTYLRYAKKYQEEHPDRIKETVNKSYFGGIREEIIQRDGEKCLDCGMTRKEHQEKWGRDITVNHINMKGCLVAKAQRDNRPENLETLCISCHSRKDNLKRISDGTFRGKLFDGTGYYSKHTKKWETRSL